MGLSYGYDVFGWLPNGLQVFEDIYLQTMVTNDVKRLMLDLPMLDDVP